MVPGARSRFADEHEKGENADMLPFVRGSLRFCAVLLAAACCLTAQSKKPADLATGKILVTPRDALDPSFAESVILLVRYGEKGVVGLMLNRQTTVPISRALEELNGSAGHPDPVFVGGPVGLETVLAVTRRTGKAEGGMEVLGDIRLVTTRTALQKELAQGTGPAGLRIYLGYCGWTQQQLQNEVHLGAWYIFEGSEALAFDDEPATLWSRLVNKTELQIARLGPAWRLR
jgi:putative transcriptional regulator